MKPKNPDLLSMENRQAIITSTRRWDSPLEVEWTLTYSGRGQINGEVQINNLQIPQAASKSLSAADQANGLTWDQYFPI
jgi:hypothetical protein